LNEDMIWLVSISLCLFFASEISYGLTRWSRKMPSPTSGTDMATIEGLLNRRIEVFILDSLPLEAVSFRFFSQERVMIRAQLWSRLSKLDQQNLILWLTLASANEHFWKRLIVGPSLSRTDRDLCVISKGRSEWATTLKTLYGERASSPPSSWGALLTGLTALGPGVMNSTVDLGQRLKDLAQQLTKLQK
jgi:hypothetical protein